MLEVEGLSVTYEPGAVHALGPLDLRLGPGETCAVIGPSGCGKSTLLHALGGVLRQYAGIVRLCGERIDPRRHAVGFIPQDFGLLPWKTVRQNCLLPLKIRGIPADSAALARYGEIVGRLGIEDIQGRFPDELSGGQRQRAAAARAFVLRPDLLLMDEPFSSLDALTRERAQELFLDLWREYRVTTVFATHSIEEAAVMGGKILALTCRPGTVAAEIMNPAFSQKEARDGKEFNELVSNIRNLLRAE